MIQATLVTGRPLTDLVALGVYDKDPMTLSPSDSIGIYRGSKNWAWVLQPGTPTSAQHLTVREQSNYRSTEMAMLLWCGDRTKTLLELALERKCLRLGSDGDGWKLLPAIGQWSQSVIKRLTSAFLQTLPSAERVVLTPKRIESWLFQSVVNQAGDVALASILTGATGTISNATLHYTWISRKQAFELHYAHIAAHERLSDLSGNPNGGELDLHIPRISKLQHHERVGHGSRFVPKTGVVRRLSGVFSSSLQSPPGNVRTISDLISFHNAYTLHSVALIGFAAGLRSVTNPIPNRHSIDRFSQFVILNDKGDTDPLRDRLAWLPDCALAQVIDYERHMAQLPSEMKRMGLSGIFDSEQLKATRSDRQAVVLLDPERGILQAPVKEIAAAFRKRGFPIRMNAWRHYFRTELVQKLPAEVLHAFLGHWQRGQEPWSGYSALDPQAYLRALKGPLEELLARDGWQAVKGLGSLSSLTLPDVTCASLTTSRVSPS